MWHCLFGVLSPIVQRKGLLSGRGKEEQSWGAYKIITDSQGKIIPYRRAFGKNAYVRKGSRMSRNDGGILLELS